MTDESPLDGFGIGVRFRSANPLEQSDPPVPDLAPGTRILPAGSVHAEGARPLTIDIEVFDDVAIPLRDGVTLYGDVYRKAGDGPVPAVLIYTPYVKRGGWWNHSHAVANFGVPAEHVSGLQPFEALDPAYWCEHGYAIVVVDARGTGHSEGDMLFMGTAEGRDAYGTVEWIAAQEWCTGKVAMAGNSQLAMVQWAAAALRPPHLTAIAPWEGLTDTYRYVIGRGGIPDTAFHDDDIIGNLVGLGRFEDMTAMLAEHPTDNAYWADKRADLSAVDIPAYVVASWTNAIHSGSTEAGFRQLASTDKWLRIHNTMEWVDIATPDSVDDLRRFFDHYLKGADNGWETTPRVRYAIIDPGGQDTHHTADTWPPAPLTATTLYLDAATGTLTPDRPTTPSSISYDSTDPAAAATFRYTVTRTTELLGPVNLRLWVETSEGNDLDLFAAVYKLGTDGELAYHVPFPGLADLIDALAKEGPLPAPLAYSGPAGRLRVSHRALDPDKSTNLAPYLSHAREEPVEPGTPVQVDLGLWPTGMRVNPGETLVVEIAGHYAGPFTPPRGTGGDPNTPIPTLNTGTHTIHTGGHHTSAALLPITR
ncbi:CocE/NonD family hydrolase [Streptomyces sp. NPDC048291]|uniref:CocE/NonD family hydrolase n=1 Tax=Streptomyces sp. NPDC048291 TaxID=3365530 RepID=UPI003722A8A0